MPPTVRITLLGDVAVEVDGRRVPDEALGPRGRVVLACLVLERDRLLPAGELADATWGVDPPDTWRPALRGTLTRVRRYLGLPRPDGAVSLDVRLGCYQLTLPSDTQVDVEHAAGAHAAAREAREAGDPTGALQAARAAAGLLRHEFLPGASGAWVESQQSRCRDLLVASLELASEAAVAAGDWEAARQAAAEVVAREPYREPAYVLLMEALAGGGDVTGAILAYRRCCEMVEQELGAVPSRATREAFLALVRQTRSDPGADGPAAATPSRVSNLPAGVSTFVGRTDQLVALRARIASHRLVTLTGMAGVGKSRLALEATRPLVPTFADGVWMVELAETTTSAGVVRHMASVLRVPDSPGGDTLESLCDHLAGKELVLVIDNCEHVLIACAGLVGTILGRCPEVRVLATSREPLHIQGEVTWPVEPLSLPSGWGSDRGLVSDALQLFADRASAARPGLDLDRAAATEVCVRLDGIPLAIELTAAHARTFSVPDLARLLAEQPQRVTSATADREGGRHRSLEAALDWSYHLLDDDERAVLGRLAVFAGGFTVAAAEAICDGLVLDVLAVLSSLVDKSLVSSRHGPETRFRLLETVRAYALAKLGVDGQVEHVRSLHLDWAYAMARHAHETADLDRIDIEQGNLRAALQSAVDTGEEVRGLRLAVALTSYWEVRGQLQEGRAWLERLAGSESVGLEDRAAALHSAGVLANHRSEFAPARAMLSEALVLRRSLGNWRGVAASLNGLASVAVASGDYEAARPMFEELLDMGRRRRDRSIIAASELNLAAVTVHALEEGVCWPYGLTDAREWLVEASAILRESGDVRGEAQASENLGVVSAMEGRTDRATTYLGQALDLYRGLGDRKGVAGTVRFLGQLAYRDGQYAAAGRLVRECLALERQLGSVRRAAEALGFLGTIAQADGRVADARILYQESLAAYAQAGNPAGADEVLRNLLALEAVAPPGP